VFYLFFPVYRKFLNTCYSYTKKGNGSLGLESCYI
jgi:hypothetical protein